MPTTFFLIITTYSRFNRQGVELNDDIGDIYEINHNNSGEFSREKKSMKCRIFRYVFLYRYRNFRMQSAHQKHFGKTPRSTLNAIRNLDLKCLNLKHCGRTLNTVSLAYDLLLWMRVYFPKWTQKIDLFVNFDNLRAVSGGVLKIKSGHVWIFFISLMKTMIGACLRCSAKNFDAVPKPPIWKCLI